MGGCRFLNLVTKNCANRVYSLRHIKLAGHLFYTSTAVGGRRPPPRGEPPASTTASTGQALRALAMSLGRLPAPQINLAPGGLTFGDEVVGLDFVTLLDDENKILCGNSRGRTGSCPSMAGRSTSRSSAASGSASPPRGRSTSTPPTSPPLATTCRTIIRRRPRCCTRGRTLTCPTSGRRASTASSASAPAGFASSRCSVADTTTTLHRWMSWIFPPTTRNLVAASRPATEMKLMTGGLSS
ncbi:hypothetical protein BS78_08G158200 [Paspalum vaginatum]|nr:hypothetical protein BS78_08G158200 [Paspalum vaginatum]